MGEVDAARAGYVARTDLDAGLRELSERRALCVAQEHVRQHLPPPPGEREDAMLPVHLLHLVDMGMTQGQNWDLERLSEDCADDGRYAFFLDATPLPFTRAVGSPLNPLVLK